MLLKTTATILALSLGLLALSSSAEAAHKYRFGGVCHHFHGEEHLVNALLQMDNALYASCEQERIVATLAARRETLAGYREVCDRLAKREALAAVRYLSRYVGTRAECDLDSAAAAITNALDFERRVHVHQVVARPPIAQPYPPIPPPVVVPAHPARSYCYTGHCHNFHGEASMIAALECMDKALLARHPVERIRAAGEVRRRLLSAYREVCNHAAKHNLIGAVSDVSRFGATGRIDLLDAAAAHVTEALAIERAEHVHVHDHGHHRAHGHGLSAVGRRPSISFGNHKVRFSIGF